MSDDHALPPPFDSMLRSLMSGHTDHASLLKMPNLNSRNFWIGAAIGAGAVMLLTSKPAATRQARGKSTD